MFCENTRKMRKVYSQLNSIKVIKKPYTMTLRRKWYRESDNTKVVSKVHSYF